MKDLSKHAVACGGRIEKRFGVRELFIDGMQVTLSASVSVPLLDELMHNSLCGMSSGEIVRKVGVPAGTVSSHISKLRADLKRVTGGTNILPFVKDKLNGGSVYKLEFPSCPKPSL